MFELPKIKWKVKKKITKKNYKWLDQYNKIKIYIKCKIYEIIKISYNKLYMKNI